MPKTNFTKVEAILNEGMKRITVKELLHLADVAMGVGAHGGQEIEPLEITLVKIHLNWFFKLDPKLYKKLGLQREEALKITKDREIVHPEKAKHFRTIKEKITEYLEEFEKDLPEDYDEKLVELAREDSVNRRFNVRSNWLPLH